MSEPSELSHNSFASYRRRYRDGWKSDNTWGGRLEKLARIIPDRLALVQGDRRLSWKQLNERVNRLANALVDLGTKKDERVGIAGFNSIEWMESYFAISKIGAVPFNINPRAALDEIGYVIKDADAVAIIVEDEYAITMERVTEGIASLRHLIVYGIGKSPQCIPHGALAYDDLMAKYPPTKPKLGYKVTNEDFCYLMYTSGTTRYPKGVVWDYETRVKGVETLIFNGLLPAIDRMSEEGFYDFLVSITILPRPRIKVLFRLIRRLGFVKKGIATFLRRAPWSTLTKLNRHFLKDGVKFLSVSPLFHATGYMQIFGNIALAGCSTVFLPTSYPFNPKELLEAIAQERPRGIIITGDPFAMTILDELKKAKKEGRTYDLSSCRVIVSSGVRWAPRVKKELWEFLPQVVLFDVYGCTEFSVAYSTVAIAEDKDVPFAGATLPARKGLFSLQAPFKVINPETGKEVKPGTGEIGEFAAGGYVSLGYWKRPALTRRVFRVIDGRRCFFTGDDGYVDEQLRFHFIGRGGKEVINTGGEKVYSEEVKELIKSHPKVRDAGVIGIPDKELGEALAAVIELEKGEELSEQDVIQHCSQSLPAHKLPKHVIFVVSLPREATGKMEKRVLKEFVESRLSSEAH